MLAVFILHMYPQLAAQQLSLLLLWLCLVGCSAGIPCTSCCGHTCVPEEKQTKSTGDGRWSLTDWTGIQSAPQWQSRWCWLCYIWSWMMLTSSEDESDVIGLYMEHVLHTVIEHWYNCIHDLIIPKLFVACTWCCSSARKLWSFCANTHCTEAVDAYMHLHCWVLQIR